MRITIATIDELRRKLDELPPQDSVKREVSKQEAVALLSDQVKALQARGYTIDEIAGLLTTGGLPLSVATLKSYLTRARTPSRKAGAKPRRAAASTRQQSEVAGAEDISKKRARTPTVALAEAQTRIELTPGVGSGGFVPREDSIDI